MVHFEKVQGAFYECISKAALNLHMILMDYIKAYGTYEKVVQGAFYKCISKTALDLH